MADEKFEWVCATPDASVLGVRVQGSPTEVVSQGLAAKNSLWKKDTVLRVRFLQGPEELHKRVLEAASQWFLDGMKLKMRQAEPGEDSEIRIAFDPNSGSWSNIGTDCLTIHPSQPTMNLGWAKLDTPKERLWSVVIHEWGHALGLLHEHNHPSALIEWNKAAVYAELAGPPNHWSRQKVDYNVFNKYQESQVIVTDFDDVSVMIYTIPSRWTTNGKSFVPSSKLSTGDAFTIKRLYS